MSASKPARRIVRTADGSPTVIDAGHGEAMHSREGAWTEARERYVEPTGCTARLRERGRASLRVLEVGAGIGLNLAALVQAAAAAREEGSRVRLEVIALERSTEALRLGIELARAEPPGAPWSRPWRTVADALEQALEAGGVAVPLGALGSLELWIGDARRRIARVPLAPPCDAVFLDAFSPGVEPECWEAGFLGALAARLAPDGWLSTYTAAARVRVALLAAGLRVGRGPRVGNKREGTLASPTLEPPPLEPRLARRLARRAAAGAPPEGISAPAGRSGGAMA